jgi:tryptophanyl-tRNA synthetase
MDLHAITVPQNPKDLQKNILDTAIIYLASSVNPEKSTIFAQSSVKEHAELAWILGSLTPMGWLNRMTQYKEISKKKLGEIKDNAGTSLIKNSYIKQRVEDMQNDQDPKKYTNLGLYSYPVLMASDILLYKTNIVPVGDDQKQHLELSRDIAGAFNNRYQTEYFTLPEPLILGNCTRVMSLQDGTKKMSKSDPSDLSRINLSDDIALINKKIKKCKTDSISGITYDKNRPEIFNLLNIFSACSGKDPKDIAKEYENSGFGAFKTDLAENLINKITPIQKNISDLKNNLDYVKNTLKIGSQKAREVASTNIVEIKKIVGLI